MAPHETPDSQDQEEVKNYVIEEYSEGRMTRRQAEDHLYQWKFKPTEIQEILNGAKKENP